MTDEYKGPVKETGKALSELFNLVFGTALIAGVLYGCFWLYSKGRNTYRAWDCEGQLGNELSNHYTPDTDPTVKKCHPPTEQGYAQCFVKVLRNGRYIFEPRLQQCEAFDGK